MSPIDFCSHYRNRTDCPKCRKMKEETARQRRDLSGSSSARKKEEIE